MVNMMMRRFAPAAVVATIAVAAAAGSAKATEITFGALSPTGLGGCSHTSGDEGLVCANGLSFSANGSTFTADGYSNAFTTPSALTFKPQTSPPGPPTNGFDESGLGENASGPPSACTDTSTPHDCEIGPGTAVTVTSTSPMDDVVIGSAQSGETAEVFVNNGSGLQLFATVTGGTCAEFMGDASTCLVSGFSTDEIGVLGEPNAGGSGSSDTTIVAVSQASVPEPASLSLLGMALTGLGLARRRRRISTTA